MIGFFHGSYIALGYVLLPIIWLYMRWRVAIGKENPNRLCEKYGRATIPRPTGSLLWIHGASVGESLSALPLVDEIRKNFPDVTILMTSGTVTSSKILKKRLPPGVLHQFVPLDIDLYVARFLDYWKPDVVCWLESEFWPNLLAKLKKNHIPVVLVNARISPGAYKSWLKFRSFSTWILSCFKMCLASTEDVAEKLQELGAQNIKMPGNLKYAAGPLPIDNEALDHLRQALVNRVYWAAVSTHPGEEKIIAQVHKKLQEKIPDFLTIVVPRHPERGDILTEDFTQQGLKVSRRALDQDPSVSTDIYLADTLGELGLFFKSTAVVFMGGSFVPIGGHNPLEPAYFGATLIWGPHMFNFSEIERSFLEEKAAYKVHSAAELERLLLDLLLERKEDSQTGKRAKKVLQKHKGVLKKTLDYVSPYIQEARRLHDLEEQNNDKAT